MPDATLDLKAVFAPLLSWRTGPTLWALSIGVSCYFILLVLHAGGGLLPPGICAGLALYSQVLTIAGAIALIVQAITMFSYIKLNDEFIRSLVFKRSSLAALIAMLIVTAWSLLASAGWAPAFDPICLYLGFLAVHTSLLPFMNATSREE